MPYHPHPHIIICTSFISSIDYNVFIVLQCHLKRPFVPKSDVKQRFTTTTTVEVLYCVLPTNEVGISTFEVNSILSCSYGVSSRPTVEDNC